MTAPHNIAVIDIGKTNAKLALVDLRNLTEVAVVTRPNVVIAGPPWPHFDVEGHWAFLLSALRQFHRDHGIEAISVTTHGASIVLLDEDGSLATPILDYEHDGPDMVTADYDALRPPFALTGSPRLPAGLNVGAQLHWQFLSDPSLKDRTAQILTYPQFWGHRLTGVAASDVTSIGCHTDLWNPRKGYFSSLPETLGISAKIAPVRKSTDILGSILPEIAEITGLPRDTPVCVGIHDSNASLYPHILRQQGAFSVVSTGTWVIVMAMNGDDDVLDSDRDTLINVNALGDAVPSARFMGGREHEIIMQGLTAEPTPKDIAQVLAFEAMLLPAVQQGTGPFQGQQMRWTDDAPEVGTGRRSAALSFYLAMMTDTCLRLTGALGPTIVEGPFAHNPTFLAMLRAATGRTVLKSNTTTGTSLGAALLFKDTADFAPLNDTPEPSDIAAWRSYASKWRVLANEAESSN